MLMYLAAVIFWAIAVALSVNVDHSAARFIAGVAAVLLVFVVPLILGGLGIASWGVACVLSLVGYAAYYFSDVVFSRSPYEVSKAKD